MTPVNRPLSARDSGSPESLRSGDVFVARSVFVARRRSQPLGPQRRQPGRFGSGKRLESGGRMKERFPLCGGVSAFLVLGPGLTALLVLAGCSANVSQTSETPLISLAITQAPPSSLNVVGAAQVSATVSGDPANAGVDWFAQCASAPTCGSFSPAHTASGAATTFTAPALVPTHNTVAVTAVSSTDHSKSSAAMVTILSTVSAVTIT